MFRAATSAMILVAGSLAASAAAQADDSCTMANNQTCEEIYLGPGFCMPQTDTTDCAGAEVLPQSDDRLLTGLDVLYMTPYMRRLARNEIFARHGYSFNSPELQEFFGARSWYAPVGQNVNLSAIESANVEFIRQVENGEIALMDDNPRSSDGQSLPPLTAWIADIVNADGTVLYGVVSGIRGRTYDPETGYVTIVRPDREDLLSYAFQPQGDDEWSVATWWRLFPPRVLEPYVHALNIVPQPIARETLFGEPVTRVHLEWSDEGGFTTLVGEAWVTDDGIFLQVNVGGVFEECCGGDVDIPWTMQYHLENLERGLADPALLEPPPDRNWGYAG